jgi:hypothetical protein
MGLLWQNSLDLPGKFTARQHHSPPAASTLQADICTETDHSPFIRTAGVRFAQAQGCIELQIREHMQGRELEGWLDLE